MGTTDRYRLVTPTPATTTAPLLGSQTRRLAQDLDAFLNPVLVADDTERDLRFPLASRREGQQVFRNDTDEIEFWDGSAWVVYSEMSPCNAQSPGVIPPAQDLQGYAIRAATVAVTFTSTNSISVPFPAPFPNACLGVQAGFLANAWYNAIETTIDNPAMLQTTSWGASAVSFATRNLTVNTGAVASGTRIVSYIAWGY
jgi:hypothetical protein